MIEITSGIKIGRLTVEKCVDKDMTGKNIWSCICECGNSKNVSEKNLQKGRPKSCGCLQKDFLRTFRFKNLSGMKFGKLKILSYAGIKNKRSFWKCECDCGKILDVESYSLTSGNSKSCGCLQKIRVVETHFIDLTGKIFGRLKVLKYNNTIKCWNCFCECGNIVNVKAGNLKSGTTKSCGCLQKEIVRDLHWRGGLRNGYSFEWTEKLKEQIRNRDNRKCQFPNCQENDIFAKKRLDVHHIDGNKKNCKPDNLISLCHKHHMKIESNPQSWEYYFYELLKDYYV